MNMFSSWNYLRTRVLTGEGDSILCINTLLPDEMIGDVFIAATTEELSSGRYDLVLAEKQLSGIYRYEEHFKTVSGVLKEGALYVLAEPVVSFEDAYTNTLLSTVDKAHVRFPRVEEIVNAASEFFQLTEFLRFNGNRELPVSPAVKDTVKKQIESMPARILEVLSPGMSGETLSLSLHTGLFVWQK